MDKIKLLGLLLLISTFQGLSQTGYELNFKVVGLTDKVIYLGYHFGDQRYVKDTVEVGFGGKVTFKGNQELPKGIYFLYSPNYYFEFIVSEQRFSLVTSTTGGYSELEVENSKENQIFKEFQLGMIALQNERKAASEQLATATTKADSALVYEKIASVDKAASEFRRNTATQYEGSFVSEIIWLMERPLIPDFKEITDDQDRSRTRYEYYKAHFFDKIDIKNTALLKTPVYSKTVQEYLDEVVIQHPDTLIAKIDWLLSAVENDEEAYRFWMVTFFTKYQKSELMGMDAIMVHLADKYYLAGKVNWVDQEAIDKLKDEISFIKPNLIGKNAPTLQLLDINLKPLNLKELTSEYTILYFYDPDCGHCKKKTPVLLEVYNKLKDQSVEVLGVCTVTDIDKWKTYVAEQNLGWKNGADPYYKSNFRQEYNVRSTPVIYVLDKSKKIIAKKLDVDQLEDFINNHRRIGSL